MNYLHVDNACILVDKPAFLRSVPGKPDEPVDSVLGRVQADYPDALIVHRLDMDTSGLMLLARGKAAQRHLNRQFQQRAVSKSYEAIVAGTVQEKGGCIQLAIAKDWPRRPRQKADIRQGKPAVSYYRRLESGFFLNNAPATRLRLYPHTGRSHQLRIHLRCIGHPIAGCDLYATAEAYDMAERLLLHACKLQFTHPASGKQFMMHSSAPF